MKTLMTFSLDLEVCRGLASYSLEHGRTPSVQVNEMLRCFLGISGAPAPDGEPRPKTPGLRCEAAIRKVVHLRRKLSLRDLKRKTHQERWGSDVWNAALRRLVEMGEVRVTEQSTPAGKGMRVVCLP